MKIYNRIVTSLGNFLDESYEDKFVILFDNNAPEDFRDYCVLHEGEGLIEPISVGNILTFGGVDYKITAIGDVVNENLHKLGHITLKFDGEIIPNQPGTLHLEEKEIKRITIGEKIEIIKN